MVVVKLVANLMHHKFLDHKFHAYLKIPIKNVKLCLMKQKIVMLPVLIILTQILMILNLAILHVDQHKSK